MYRQPAVLILPELVSLGLFRTSESRLGGVRTDGPSGLEIGFLERGSVEWWNGKELREAGPSSVLIDHPDSWQGGTDAIVHPCTRYWLRFNFPESGALPGLSQATTTSMRDAFEAIDGHFFPGETSLRDFFRQLIGQQRHPSAYSEEFSRALFHQILITVLKNHETSSRRRVSASILAATAFIDENYREKIIVDHLARIAGFSTGHFHAVFIAEMGMSPAQYHRKLRITEAKRALVFTDRLITDIAIDLGFSSSQYFSSSFRKLVGLTPERYRKIRTGGTSRGSQGLAATAGLFAAGTRARALPGRTPMQEDRGGFVRSPVRG
jgi:AraC family L-rhamnose operon regulatory protein RhaS